MLFDLNVNNNVNNSDVNNSYNYSGIEDSQIMNLINGDWDPRKISYAMIFIVVLVTMGMSPLEQQMANIAKNQEIIDGLDSNIIDFSAIISQLESESGKNGFSGSTAQLTQFLNELKSFFKNTFGSGLTPKTINGTVYYLPHKNANGTYSGTAYGDMIQSWLNQHPGQGISGFLTSSPAIASLNQFAGELYNTPAPGQGSWAYFMEGGPNYSGQSFTGLINSACADYYRNNNPGSNSSGTVANPLKDMYTWSSASQGALQGLGSQNTAQIQTDTSSETSLDQTGQNAIQGFDGALNMMIQNQKAT